MYYLNSLINSIEKGKKKKYILKQKKLYYLYVMNLD